MWVIEIKQNKSKIWKPLCYINAMAKCSFRTRKQATEYKSVIQYNGVLSYDNTDKFRIKRYSPSDTITTT